MLDVIEFFDQSGEIMVTRIPYEGSAEMKLGSQLIVQESQVAVFFRDGQALDGFEAGRHTLTTQNMPLLGGLLGSLFNNQSPFRSYVYFVASKTFINLGWGTQSPVMFRDTDFRMISLRAHGAFSIKITKPRVFLNTLVGTRGMETTFALEDFFRTVIVSRFNEVVGQVMTSILDLPIHYNTIGLKVKQAVADDFEQYGIQLVDLLVQAITPPPEVQEMINKASGMAIQDIEKYQAISASDALRDAAKNSGGGSLAGDGIGAGLGLAMGMGMAQQTMKQLAPEPNIPQSSEPVNPGPQKLTIEELKTKLTELKELQELGLIDEGDFEAKKKNLLSNI